MLQNQLKNNSKVIKIILGIVIIASLTGAYFNVSKQNEEKKALETVQTRNYQVINSLFSSDQARTNLKNYSDNLRGYDLTEDECLKVAEGRARIECKSLVANMNQLKNNQEKNLRQTLTATLLNYNYFDILQELFERNQKDDLSKILTKDDYKKLLIIFEKKKEDLSKLSSYTIDFVYGIKHHDVIENNSSGKFYREDYPINQLNKKMISALEYDCKRTFETDNCYITKEEIEQLNRKSINDFSSRLSPNDPYIELSQRIINKAFNKPILKLK